MWAQLSAFSQVLFIPFGPHLPPVAPICSILERNLSLHSPKCLSTDIGAHCMQVSPSPWMGMWLQKQVPALLCHRAKSMPSCKTELSGRKYFDGQANCCCLAPCGKDKWLDFLFASVNLFFFFLIFHLVTQDLKFWQHLETVDSFSKWTVNFVSEAVTIRTLIYCNFKQCLEIPKYILKWN